MGVLTTRAGFPHGPPLSQSPGCGRLRGGAADGRKELQAPGAARPTPVSRLFRGRRGSAVPVIEFHGWRDCGDADGSGSPDRAVGCLGRDTKDYVRNNWRPRADRVSAAGQA